MTRTPILGERWRFWDEFAVRGPGFPADGVLRLAPTGVAEAADKFVAGDRLDGPQWQDFAGLFAQAGLDTAHELQHIARLPAFRAAVAWQNRQVLSSGIAPFLRWDPDTQARSSMPRQREELVAHYWQRFCVKNDTIGFFGPVGWGRWDDGVAGVSVEPGAGGLVARSTVYFATWAIDAVAAMVDRQPELRGRVAPRRMPYVAVRDGRVIVPGRPPQSADPTVVAVLDRCDGIRTADAIAAALPGVDVPAALAELVRRRWAVWRLELPAVTHPERHLRAWLERADYPPGLAVLDELERGRERVAAAGDAEQLIDALSDLEQRFATLTGAAAVREKSAGAAPCRALVYADSRRAATTRVGAAVREALAPLAPLMASAGWLTSRLAATVTARIHEVHRQLAASGPVDLASFWFGCMPILHGAARDAAGDLQQEFQRRWATVLALPDDTDRVRRTLPEITAAVADQFGDHGGGWSTARYLSPDIMIAADGADAVARGDFTLVLGELHLAANTVGSSLFVNQHPRPADLLAATGRDNPEPRLLPLLPKEHRSRLSIRTRQQLVRPEDYQVALADMTADRAGARTVASADVRVVDDDGTLTAVLPDGARFPVTEVFSHVLTTLAMDLFQPLPEAAHTPRVTVDRFVMARERWRIPVADATFAAEKDEAKRYVLARQWRERHRLPRFVFVVSATEPRPFYVDFDSPVYVTILAKALRRLDRADARAAVTVTEMLPGPDQTWLTCDEGLGYTAELRFVAVDER
ncbi:lantibiotic dehydratase [Actinoplanes sp. NPDC049118]|uniref:lantibiotic dehydratase n=1 Tax=Actinoplanes sp. NPDC049118 TaxID=3155769 RepID=UPI0033D16BAE